MLNSKLQGSLIVGFMALIGTALGSVLNHSVTLREIAEQEVVKQVSAAAVDYIRLVAESTLPKTDKEEYEARVSLAVSRATMILYGKENLVRSLSNFDKHNCPDLTDDLCRDRWTELLSEIKKEVSGVSYKGIESDIGIILFGGEGQN